MQKQNWNRDWRFYLGDPPGAHWEEKLDHADWPVVDLPHDWSIALDRAPTNPSGPSGGYFATGLGWYHKPFHAPPEWRGKKVLVEFEGVYMNADISLNKHALGRHPYGYTSFHRDLTPYLNFDAENVLQVVVDNASQVNSRWYSGSGIYRPVWLYVADPVHVGPWGVFVTTPQVSAEAALVHVRTTVENETAQSQAVVVRSRVVAPDGSPVGTAETSTTISGRGSGEYDQDVSVPAPQLWSLDTPRLYRLETEVLVGGAVVDTATTTFGIRSLHFSADSGFLLNGQPLKLKGGCVHHDNGVMGAAAYARAEERKVELLKASGFNAVRCAHNPPAPAFLDACDRLGMLIIDQAFDCWRSGKNHYDYHVCFDDWWQRDLDSMLYRDRNHPSVIMWSIGNELLERGRAEGAQIARTLADRVRAVDPTRPVTAGINKPKTAPWPNTDPVFAALDVGGYNYLWKFYHPDHERQPERVIFGSESAPLEAFDTWSTVLELDCVVGDFVWTSLDYLGEAGIGRVYFAGDEASFLGSYPWVSAYCGDIDLCGFKRPQSYYRDVLWQRGDPLYIAVHNPVPAGKTPVITYWGWPDVWPNWTWPGREGQSFQVDVYSACDAVELFLNGRSLGVKPTTRQERFIAAFDAPYEPGELKAVGVTGGRPSGECVLKTTGAPAQIRLTPDRGTLKAGANDLCYVTVEILDQDGLLHPTAENMVYVTTQGAGEIAAVGNGNPRAEEPYRGNQRRAYRGRCLVVIRAGDAPGEVTLRAQAAGLQAAEVTIRVE